MQSLRSLWPRAAAPRRAFSTTSPRSLARMQLLGRLGDAPEVNATSSGQEIIRLSLGVSSGPKSEDGTRNTSWFRLTSFAEGPKKEVLCGLQKGCLMWAEGDARMDRFQAADGTHRTQLNLLLRNFEVLARPRPREDKESSTDNTPRE